MQKWLILAPRHEIDERGQKAAQHSETTPETKPDSYVCASEGLSEERHGQSWHRWSDHVTKLCRMETRSVRALPASSYGRK